MAAYKLIDTGASFLEIQNKIYRMIEEKVKWAPATPRTPGAVWYDVSKILDPSIREKLSELIRRPIHEIVWMTDYKDCKSLEIHKDNPGNEYPIHSRFTLIMMIDGVFQISIWNDDCDKVIDQVVVKPGQFVILNNSQYYHSGEVLQGRKLSLHAYPEIIEIDGTHKPDRLYQVENFVG